jgi:signal transduction histidine kinase
MLKVVIFRVLQEAVNNAAKHSSADLVRLSLRRTGDAVELSVQDNGSGFEFAKTGTKDASRKGLGLASMKERTELSGGSFAIDSTLGSGTTIRASWSCI